MAVGEDVYFTLVMNDAYLPGAAVLAKSLRDAGTQYKLACMIVQENLKTSTVEELQSLYNYVIPISSISSPNIAALYLMRRPDLQNTFTKIHLWRFTQFRKIVYVDADVVALRAPDELFDISDHFAAAPDVGFPSIFNTGVMVLTPDSGTYAALRSMANAGDSFDGADQGLINQFYEHKKWKLLSFTYNCTPNASYQYEPAYRYFKRNISMVHFIGSEKPWQKARSAAGSSGAYQELLSRWWAVYDRHFHVPPADYIAGNREVSSHGLPQGGTAQPYSSVGYPIGSTGPAPPPGSRDMSADGSFTDRGERAQNIDQGRIEPTPTVQARKFSAPHMEWDGTRGAPPSQSRPEAANFPTTTYEFSTDATPYRPPKLEPKIPRDIHYDISKARSEEKLTPIFPWEERGTTAPTRTFIEDEPPPPAPEEDDEEEVTRGLDEFEVRVDQPASVSPVTPTFNTLGLFDARSKNAWDDVSGIDSYVRALSEHQRQRGQTIPTVPTAAITSGTSAAAGHVLSPTTEIKADELIEQVAKRRESLLLTDFPSAIDRPSLPVTPAPVRRSTFWGGEEEDEESMPAAEGVPRQQDWDPSAQLEQLRRNSLIDVKELKMPERRPIPDRAMPGNATTMQEAVVVRPAVVLAEGNGGTSQASSTVVESDSDGKVVSDRSLPLTATTVQGAVLPTATVTSQESGTKVQTASTAERIPEVAAASTLVTSGSGALSDQTASETSATAYGAATNTATELDGKAVRDESIRQTPVPTTTAISERDSQTTTASQDYIQSATQSSEGTASRGLGMFGSMSTGAASNSATERVGQVDQDQGIQQIGGPATSTVSASDGRTTTTSQDYSQSTVQSSGSGGSRGLGLFGSRSTWERIGEESSLLNSQEADDDMGFSTGWVSALESPRYGSQESSAYGFGFDTQQSSGTSAQQMVQGGLTQERSGSGFESTQQMMQESSGYEQTMQGSLLQEGGSSTLEGSSLKPHDSASLGMMQEMQGSAMRDMQERIRQSLPEGTLQSSQEQVEEFSTQETVKEMTGYSTQESIEYQSEYRTQEQSSG